jgi:hypothetical protein
VSYADILLTSPSSSSIHTWALLRIQSQKLSLTLWTFSPFCTATVALLPLARSYITLLLTCPRPLGSEQLHG